MDFDHIFVQSDCSPLRRPKKIVHGAHPESRTSSLSRTKEQRGSRFPLSDCRSSRCEACLCPRINDREAEMFIIPTESRWSRTAVQSPWLFNVDLCIIGFAYLYTPGLVHTGLHCQHSAFAMYIVFYLKDQSCMVSFKALATPSVSVDACNGPH